MSMSAGSSIGNEDLAHQSQREPEDSSTQQYGKHVDMHSRIDMLIIHSTRLYSTSLQYFAAESLAIDDGSGL